MREAPERVSDHGIVTGVSEELVVPGVGEVVDLSDEVACVQALVAVRDFESQLREAKAALTQAITERARLLGTQSFELPDGRKVALKGGPETAYDAQEIEAGLRALGMPEERIREIVIEEVSYKVSAREAKRAAAANEEYEAVINNAKDTIEKPHYVTVTRR